MHTPYLIITPHFLPKQVCSRLWLWLKILSLKIELKLDSRRKIEIKNEYGGINTFATYLCMIEKLKTREFILLNKRNLISTQKCFDLF